MRTIMVSWISRRCFVMLPILVRNRRRNWMISVRCASLSPSARCKMGMHHVMQLHFLDDVKDQPQMAALESA